MCVTFLKAKRTNTLLPGGNGPCHLEQGQPSLRLRLLLYNLCFFPANNQSTTIMCDCWGEDVKECTGKEIKAEDRHK